MSKSPPGGGEDFLGFIAFGSLVANVAQAVSRSNLEVERDQYAAVLEEFRIAAEALSAQYDALAGRYEIATREYAVLRNQHERLWGENQQLRSLLSEAQRSSNQLFRENSEQRKAIAKLETEIAKRKDDTK